MKNRYIFNLLVMLSMSWLSSFAQAGTVVTPATPAAATITINGPVQTIYNWQTDQCNPTDFPDNPARAFVDSNNNVHLLANDSNGYYGRIGSSLNGPFTSTCSPILASTNIGLAQQPNQYNNYIWFMSAWTNDGNTIYALIHNEFHGQAAASSFCNVSGTFHLPECQYWNIVAATSTNSGNNFTINLDAESNPQLVMASPYQYSVAQNNSLQGMPAQTNIVQNPNDNAYYMLVNQSVANGNPTGICLFRTTDVANPSSWRGWNGMSNPSNPAAEYTIAMNQNPYETTITNPAQSICAAINMPAWISANSLTYNTAINQFIMVGTDTNFPNPDGTGVISAFVYMTSPDLINWSSPQLLMQIVFMNDWIISTPNSGVTGQAYPSLLDPSMASTRRNFDWSGNSPYLYFTFMNPKTTANGGNNRNLVRVPLTVTPIGGSSH